MTGNDENGGGMNQSIIESATREHVYTGFVDPRKCSTQKTVFTETYDTFGRSRFFSWLKYFYSSRDRLRNGFEKYRVPNLKMGAHHGAKNKRSRIY